LFVHSKSANNQPSFRNENVTSIAQKLQEKGFDESDTFASGS
jgi:hypothetical protein